MTSLVNKKLPLMPKATAIWLVENTSLTFTQIAEFCGFHELEIHAIADGETLQGMMGVSPVAMGQLTVEEIERCQKDPSSQLRIQETAVDELFKKKVKKTEEKAGGKYTPRARRGERPDAIAWLVKNYPMITDAQIGRLIGTTKPTIEAIRTRTHWNMASIKPRSPVILGFCSQEELDKISTSSQKKDTVIKSKSPSKPKKEAAVKAKKMPKAKKAKTSKKETKPLKKKEADSKKKPTSSKKKEVKPKKKADKKKA